MRENVWAWVKLLLLTAYSLGVVDERKRRKRVKGTSGRVTKKDSSPRYTAPVPQKIRRPSKIPLILTFVFFAVGVLLILLNYLPGAPLIPGDTSNWNLLIGLVLICLGFGTSTQIK